MATGRLITSFHRLYKLCLSPLFGNCCRFHPSCSDYARQAVELHGWIGGSRLIAKRICRCHPWHPGGHDPVPETFRTGLKNSFVARLKR
ncbi:MAG: membrane protein insertion efficiency factor YidD [Pseudomonadota bacterium]